MELRLRNYLYIYMYTFKYVYIYIYIYTQIMVWFLGPNSVMIVYMDLLGVNGISDCSVNALWVPRLKTSAFPLAYSSIDCTLMLVLISARSKLKILRDETGSLGIRFCGPCLDFVAYYCQTMFKPSQML